MLQQAIGLSILFFMIVSLIIVGLTNFGFIPENVRPSNYGIYINEYCKEVAHGIGYSEALACRAFSCNYRYICVLNDEKFEVIDNGNWEYFLIPLEKGRKVV